MTYSRKGECDYCGHEGTVKESLDGEGMLCRVCFKEAHGKCDVCKELVPLSYTTEPLRGKYKGGTVCFDCIGE